MRACDRTNFNGASFDGAWIRLAAAAEILSTFAIALAASALGVSALFAPLGARAEAGVVAAGPEVPFPLSEQIPIPWEALGGMWESSDKGEPVLYSFELDGHCFEQPALRILQVRKDPRSVIAWGYGYAHTEMQVQSVMHRTDSESGAYVAILRAFRDRGRAEFVLTTRSLREPEADLRHVVLRRASKEPIAPWPEREEGGKRECETEALSFVN